VSYPDPDEDDDEDEADSLEGDEGPDDATWTHAPVMVEEVLATLLPDEGPKPPVLYDLTLGLGGHLRAFLERAGPDARAFGLDGDPLAIERTRPRLAAFGERATLAHANLREVARVAAESKWPRPTAVLLDLGLSSPQIEEPGRGFSYRREGPLDMRFDPTRGMTAAQLLLALPSRELAAKIGELGDEPLADEIVKLVKRRLPVETTTQLAAIVVEAYGRRYSRVHPARRTFQALRIMVNEEIETLIDGLEASIDLLVPGGRVAILSYHSGEDRPVKQVLRGAAQAGRIRLLARRPARPTEKERWTNQRARSAKMRSAEKLA
jgi:16S rRNA (cytosine1402-N4)-methyltransferase